MKRLGAFTIVTMLVLAIFISLTGFASADAKRGGDLVAVINHAPRHFNGTVHLAKNRQHRNRIRSDPDFLNIF